MKKCFAVLYPHRLSLPVFLAAMMPRALSKKSQVSFPRVLSLFKMRTQCSDTMLSLVRAVLGTDETLDCWLQVPDIRDLSRNLRSRCCMPRETSNCTQKDDKEAKINDSSLRNYFLAYTPCEQDKNTPLNLYHSRPSSPPPPPPPKKNYQSNNAVIIAPSVGW